MMMSSAWQRTISMLEYIGGSAIYALLKDGWALMRGRRRRLKPAEILALRQKWKKEFEPKIFERHRKELGLDVIVRDMKRLDNYPDDVTPKKGVSAWFKAGLMATYHNGLQMGLGWYSLKKDKSGWRHVDHRNEEEGDATVVMIGDIPYENIETIDWTGDTFYGNPQLYCHFDASRGQPYQRLYFCTEHQNPGGSRFYIQVATVAEVMKNTKRARIKYP